MKHVITIIISSAFALTVAAQEMAKAPVSAEFARAANLALVAVKNSDNTSLSLDKTVEEAINNADAAAVADPEIGILKRIKALSAMRPITLNLYLLKVENASTMKAMRASGACMKKHPDCHAGDAAANAEDAKEVDKVKAELDAMEVCITALRVNLRELSGTMPKECADEKK